MRFRIRLSRYIAWLILPLFLTTNLCFADASTVQSVYKLTVPEDHGKISERWIGKQSATTTPDSEQSPFIVVVQDAHDTFDAQKNIAEIIHSVAAQLDPREVVIGIEGAVGKIHTNDLRRYPVREVREAASEDLLRRGFVTGAEHAAIASLENLSVWGVEDKELFTKDLRYFQTVQGYRHDVEAYFSAIDETLAFIKQKKWNETLRTFDYECARYSGDPSQFSNYISYIEKILSECDAQIDLFDYPQVLLFREIAHLSAQVRPEVLHAEVTKLVTLLNDQAEAKKIVVPETTDALNYQFVSQVWAQAIKSQMIRTNDYATIEKQLLLNRKFAILNIPELSRELTLVARDIRLALATSEEERTLIAIDYDLALCRKVFCLEGVRDEVHAVFPDGEASIFTARNAELKALASRYSSELFIPQAEALFAHVTHDVKEFYDLAEQRESGMLDSLLRKIDIEGKKGGVLVVGGYHAYGITALLKEKKIPYASIMPSITDMTFKSGYLDRMMQTLLPMQNPLASYIHLSRINALMQELYGEFGVQAVERAFGKRWADTITKDPAKYQDYATIIMLAIDNAEEMKQFSEYEQEAIKEVYQTAKTAAVEVSKDEAIDVFQEDDLISTMARHDALQTHDVDIVKRKMRLWEFFDKSIPFDKIVVRYMPMLHFMERVNYFQKEEMSEADERGYSRLRKIVTHLYQHELKQGIQRELRFYSILESHFSKETILDELGYEQITDGIVTAYVESLINLKQQDRTAMDPRILALMEFYVAMQARDFQFTHLVWQIQEATLDFLGYPAMINDSIEENEDRSRVAGQQLDIVCTHQDVFTDFLHFLENYELGHSYTNRMSPLFIATYNLFAGRPLHDNQMVSNEAGELMSGNKTIQNSPVYAQDAQDFSGNVQDIDLSGRKKVKVLLIGSAEKFGPRENVDGNGNTLPGKSASEYLAEILAQLPDDSGIEEVEVVSSDIHFPEWQYLTFAEKHVITKEKGYDFGDGNRLKDEKVIDVDGRKVTITFRKVDITDPKEDLVSEAFDPSAETVTGDRDDDYDVVISSRVGVSWVKDGDEKLNLFLRNQMKYLRDGGVLIYDTAYIDHAEFFVKGETDEVGMPVSRDFYLPYRDVATRARRLNTIKSAFNNSEDADAVLSAYTEREYRQTEGAPVFGIFLITEMLLEAKMDADLVTHVLRDGEATGFYELPIQEQIRLNDAKMTRLDFVDLFPQRDDFLSDQEIKKDVLLENEEIAIYSFVQSFRVGIKKRDFNFIVSYPKAGVNPEAQFTLLSGNVDTLLTLLTVEAIPYEKRVFLLKRLSSSIENAGKFRGRVHPRSSFIDQLETFRKRLSGMLFPSKEQLNKELIRVIDVHLAAKEQEENVFIDRTYDLETKAIDTHEVITLNGLPLSGKTRAGQIVAKKLGYTYLNVGDVARAVTYALYKDEYADINKPQTMTKFLSQIKDRLIIEPSAEDRSGVSIVFDGEKLTPEILHAADISGLVDKVARSLPVDLFLRQTVRTFGEEYPAVIDALMAGQFIFNEDDWLWPKFYLKASVDEMTFRKYEQDGYEMPINSPAGQDMLETLRREIVQRNRTLFQDKADDEIEIDTTAFDPAAVADEILAQRQRHLSEHLVKSEIEGRIEQYPIKKQVITIDGFAGVGKTNVGFELAHRLGYLHLSFGGFARAITAYLREASVDFKDPIAVSRALESVALSDIDIVPPENGVGGVTFKIKDMHITYQTLIEPELSEYVDIVGGNLVANRLICLKSREFGAEHNIVVDGRIAGSVIFDDEKVVKFYLGSAEDAMVERRMQQYADRGIPIDEESVRELVYNLNTYRVIKPKDALEIDRTNMSDEALVEMLQEYVSIESQDNQRTRRRERDIKRLDLLERINKLRTDVKNELIFLRMVSEYIQVNKSRGERMRTANIHSDIHENILALHQLRSDKNLFELDAAVHDLEINEKNYHTRILVQTLLELHNSVGEELSAVREFALAFLELAQEDLDLVWRRFYSSVADVRYWGIAEEIASFDYKYVGDYDVVEDQVQAIEDNIIGYIRKLSGDTQTIMSQPDTDKEAPLKYDFYAVENRRAERGRFSVQLNPERKGKRPSSYEGAGLFQPYDKDAFHYNEPSIAYEEIITDKMIDGVDTGFVVNTNPFAEGHFLMIPERALGDTEQGHPQYLDDIRFVRMAMTVMQNAERDNLKLIYNSMGAFGTQNHFHFQGFFYGGDGQSDQPIWNEGKLAVELSGRSELKGADGRVISFPDGVSVKALADYPARGLVFSGENKALLERAVFNYVQVLNAKNIAHNVLFTKNEIIVMPRKFETANRFGAGTASYEMSGEFIVFDKEIFDTVTEEDIWNELAATTIADGLFEETVSFFSAQTALQFLPDEMAASLAGDYFKTLRANAAQLLKEDVVREQQLAAIEVLETKDRVTFVVPDDAFENYEIEMMRVSAEVYARAGDVQFITADQYGSYVRGDNELLLFLGGERLVVAEDPNYQTILEAVDAAVFFGGDLNQRMVLFSVFAEILNGLISFAEQPKMNATLDAKVFDFATALFKSIDMYKDFTDTYTELIENVRHEMRMQLFKAAA